MREEFHVAYNPVPTANRVAKQGRLVLRSIIQVILGAAVWSLVLWWQRASIPGVRWWLVAGYLVAVGQIAWRVARLVLARRDLAGIGTGDALVVSASGITGERPGQERLDIPWAQVASLVGRDRIGGRGPDLVITRHDGTEWSVPLAFLDAPVGTLDNAVRVYSGGTKGLDLADLSI